MLSNARLFQRMANAEFDLLSNTMPRTIARQVAELGSLRNVQRATADVVATRNGARLVKRTGAMAPLTATIVERSVA